MSRRSSANSIGSNVSGNSIGSNNGNNSNGSLSFCCSRLKRFQICLWITVAFTFLHLGTKPMVSPPEKLEVKKNKTESVSSITSHKNSSLTTSFSSSSSSSSSRDDESNDHDDTILSDTQQGQHDSFRITSDPPQTESSSSGESSSTERPTLRPSSPSSSNSSIISSPTTPSSFSQSTFKILDPASSFIIHPPKSNDNLSKKEQRFVEQYCDLTNVKDGAWYPTSEDTIWQQRAPYIIIAGVWNSGVNPLAKTLLRHPQIDPAKINGFFLPKQFNWYYGLGGSSAISNNLRGNSTTTATLSMPSFEQNLNVKVFGARERMYAQVYSPSSLKDTTNDNENDNSTTSTSKNKLLAITTNNSNNIHNMKGMHVAMDISPGLLFHARTTSPSILCVSPWAKIIILLRNPVDRIYQQYIYSVINLKLPLTLEDWLAQEMKVMQNVGLIGRDKNQVKINKDDSFVKDEQSSSPTISEKEAWNKYQNVRNVGGAIGRSMYILQLEDWINTYIEAGKIPSEEIFVLASEHVEEDPYQQYVGLIDFLGLTPINVTSNGNLNLGKPTVPKNIEPMKKETRNMLNQFFRPYNQRLSKLLKSNGFKGHWDKIWK